MLYKSEWPRELKTWPYKVNYIDILTNSPLNFYKVLHSDMQLSIFHFVCDFQLLFIIESKSTFREKGFLSL